MLQKKFEDAKWIIRSHNPQKYRKISGQTIKNKQWSTNTTQKEENEDTKGVIRIRKSKKYRQHNDQKEKRTNDYPQNTTQKTKDRATRSPLKTRGELRCSERVGSSCCTSGTSRVTLVKIR